MDYGKLILTIIMRKSFKQLFMITQGLSMKNFSGNENMFKNPFKL
jgi:hypothetical protein